MTPFCAAIDWGTSRFRFWLLAEDGRVLSHISTNEGLQKSADIGFETVLETHLQQLNCPSSLPVVICGMAGSRSGWVEAPYLEAPIALDQIVSNSIAVPNTKRPIHILPGIAQRSVEKPDVIRGEETQLFGMLKTIGDKDQNRLICMPGTHSKWVGLEGASLKQFATFMTGELFALLKKHSVLKMAIENSSNVSADDPVFIKHFEQAIQNPAALSSHLFSLRSAQLLGYASPFEGLAALSGCLIGLEFAGAFERFDKPKEITLLASGNLGDLYRIAFEHCGIQTTSIDAETAGLNGLFASAMKLWGTEEQPNKQSSIGTS